MDKLGWYNSLLVNKNHLLTLQNNVENAQRNTIKDAVGVGVVSGLQLVQSATPDLYMTINPGVCYTPAGLRIEVATNQQVDLGTINGNSTAVASGKERWMGMYLRFIRTQQDAYTADGGGYFTQNEYYEIVTVAATEQNVGTDLFPAPPSGDVVLLGRVRRINGQSAYYTVLVNYAGVPRIRRATDTYATAVDRRLECLQTDPPSLAVTVKAGSVLIDAIRVAVNEQTIPITAPITNLRYTLVYVDSSGNVGLRHSAESATPSRPNTRGVVPVAYIGMGPGQSTIDASQIEDARPWFQAETTVNRYHRLVASGGETVISLPYSYTQGVNALEVVKNGTELDNTEYTETSTTSITLAVALTAGQKLVVKATDIAPIGVGSAHQATHAPGGSDPLSGLMLSQLSDKVDGLLIGGDVLFTPPALSNAKNLTLNEITCLVLRKKVYSKGTTTALNESSLEVAGSFSADTRYFVYAKDNAGALQIVINTNPPDGTLTYEAGSDLKRYLGTFRTDGSGNILPFRKQGRLYLYTTRYEAYNGTDTVAAVAASLGTWVPSHSRVALIQQELVTNSSYNNTLNGALVIVPGTSVSRALRPAIPVGASTTAVTFPVETNSTQQVQVQLINNNTNISSHRILVEGFQE